MKTQLLVYRLSLLLTVVLTTLGFIAVLDWLATLLNGAGVTSATVLPWWGLLWLGFTAINCTLRSRILGWRVKIDHAG